MDNKERVFEVPEMSPDQRIRVFRRALSGLDDFASMEVDSYVVLGERYVIILDTLLCPADMAGVMEIIGPEVGERTLLCVNSHADWDHIWGNSYFTGKHHLPIVAHERCWQRVQSEDARAQLTDYQARYPVFQDVKLVAPTLVFSERLVIDTGDLTLELLHAPGHCQDQIVAWFPELRLLLAFDAVENPLPCLENAAGAPHMFATLEHLIALNARQVLCSHGKTTSPALISANLAYLREIERHSRNLLNRHQPEAAELEHAAELVGYPFDLAIAHLDASVEIDREFYSWAHENNVRAILGML